MKKQFIFLLVLLVFENVFSNEAYLDWADKACGRIEFVYSQCETGLTRFENLFMFSKTHQNVLCTDGDQKSFYERLKNMDIASIFMISYQKGNTPLPENRKNYDPGRLRSEALLKEIYGFNESEVQRSLVKVDFLGQTVWFQKKLGAANALAQVSKDIIQASQKDSSIVSFLKIFFDQKEKGMTFNWRLIAGTDRLSTHSFGTAIDLVVPEVKAQYWLWDEKKSHSEKAQRGEIAYENDHFKPAHVPYFHPKVVEIFEKNGFIWGGKWNHYDTMHFEYRPEFFEGYKINCATGAL